MGTRTIKKEIRHQKENTAQNEKLIDLFKVIIFWLQRQIDSLPELFSLVKEELFY